MGELHCNRSASEEREHFGRKGAGGTTPSGPRRAWLNTGRRRTDVQNYIHLTKSSRVLGRAVLKKNLARQRDLNACAPIGYEKHGYGIKKNGNFFHFFHCVFAIEARFGLRTKGDRISKCKESCPPLPRGH